MVAPNTDRIGVEQQRRDFRSSFRPGKRIDGITDCDNTINAALTEKGKSAGQLGRVAVNIGNQSQSHA